MDVRSDPAGPGDKMLGVARIPALKDHFDAPEHLAGAPGVDNLTASHLDLYPEVALDPGNWINHNSLAHIYSSLLLKRNGSLP
jgi:hypothetical protein